MLRIIVEQDGEVTSIHEYVGQEDVNAVRAALVRLVEDGPLSSNSQNFQLWQGEQPTVAQKAFREFMRCAGWGKA
jgi:hypothetical protein